MKSDSNIKKLIDINIFAINLVTDHPGYSYVEPLIAEGLRGDYKLIILDIVPFRVHWIMTKFWKFPKKESQEVILDFILENPNIQYIGLNLNAIVQAFELSKNLKHDIYDCYYLAGAISFECQSVMTTDTGFEKLCKKLYSTKKISIEYQNPVPKHILAEFSNY